MLEMEGGEGLDAEEKAKSASLIKDAAERKRIRIQMEAKSRASANAASGLPKNQKDLLLGIKQEKKYGGEAVTDIFSGPCRSVIATSGGEIIGQLLGDCVGLEASAALVNGVELFMKLQFSGVELNNTIIGQYSGILFDFARKGTVPTNYSMYTPPEISAEAGEIPGEVATALWNWDSNLDWGRMKPGENTFTPLNLETWKRKMDTELCAKVLTAGWTYCPIARLDSSFYTKLPRMPGEDEFPNPDSTCPAMDNLLAPIQTEQVALGRTAAAYVELDVTVSSKGLMNDEQMYRDFRAQQTDLGGLGCPYGRSLVFRDDSFRCT